MPNDEQRIEEKALSQAAEIGISNQLDAVEKINVDVRTNLLKMAQGKADSVSVKGQGLVVEKDIRVQEMELHTRDVAIDLISAIFGEVELDQPTDATIRLVLKESDLNRAIKSEFVRKKMSSFPIELSVGDEFVTLQLLQSEIQLRGGGKMMFSGNILVQEKDKAQEIGFTAAVKPRTDDHPVLLEGFYCNQGQGIAFELAYAFFRKANELMNLRYFELEGTAFRIKKMLVQESSLTLEVEAHVRHIPSL